MKQIKAIFLTLSLYTFLFWLYIGGRIIFSGVPLNDLFIDFVPFFTFAISGAIAFILSMIFTYLYLTTN